MKENNTNFVDKTLPMSPCEVATSSAGQFSGSACCNWRFQLLSCTGLRHRWDSTADRGCLLSSLSSPHRQILCWNHSWLLPFFSFSADITGRYSSRTRKKHKLMLSFQETTNQSITNYFLTRDCIPVQWETSTESPSDRIAIFLDINQQASVEFAMVSLDNNDWATWPFQTWKKNWPEHERMCRRLRNWRKQAEIGDNFRVNDITEMNQQRDESRR